MIGGFLLVVVWLWYGCRFLVNDWVYVVGLWLLGLWWLWYGWLGLCGGFVSDCGMGGGFLECGGFVVEL